MTTATAASLIERSISHRRRGPVVAVATRKVTYLVGSSARDLAIDVGDLASVDPDDADAVERAIKDRILDDLRRNVILEELVPGNATDVIDGFADAIRDARAARSSAEARTRADEGRASLTRRRAASGGGQRKAAR